MPQEVAFQDLPTSLEDPKLIIRVINFELVQPVRPRYVNVSLQTDGQTDDLA